MTPIHLALPLVMTAASLVAASPAQDWQPCMENAQVDCATVPVPVDWDDPAGAEMTIAVARRSAPDPRGVLIYLPAGPGSSGVDAVTDDRQFTLLFPPEVAAHFDVVGFDPRGVRRSNPVRCDAELVAALDRPAPTTQREFDALLDAQAAVGADCRKRTGPVFDHLDSTQSARDVDAIRAALGVEQVNLYGLSYGTVIGQMYAERFGGRIRTLTLDAVYDHSAGSNRFDVTGALAAQESFDQFVHWCATTPACELHDHDVRHLVADLFATTSDPSGLTHELVSPLTRPDLPGLAHRIAVLAGLAPETTAARTAPAPAPEIPLPIYTVCADTRVAATTFAHRQALAAAQRRVAPDVRSAAFGIPTLCVNPPVPATNPHHRLHAPDAPPALVMSSRYDPSTPYQGARRVADQLPQARLVTHLGLGHGIANRTDCARATFTRYLLDRTLPTHDVHCRA